MNQNQKNFWLALAVMAVVLVCLFTVLYRYRKRDESSATSNAIIIGRAIFSYYDHYSCFPYDSRGSDYALSQLHGFMPESQWPSVFESSNDRSTRAVYRPAEQRIVGSDFIYLNPAPGIRLEEGEAILWERKDIRDQGRWLVLLDNKQGFRIVFEEKDTASPPAQ